MLPRRPAPHSVPPPEIERTEELDLLHMHGTSARVSGDRHTPGHRVSVSPPVVTFEIPEESVGSMLAIRSKWGMFDHPSLLGESAWLSHSSFYDRCTLCALVRCVVETRGQWRLVVHFWVCFKHCHAWALSWDLRSGNAYKWVVWNVRVVVGCYFLPCASVTHCAGL
jgi:hypothetical protein